MKRNFTAAAALLASTSLATAGGVDRSGQNIGVIFEQGNYAEFSFGYVSPDVSGTLGPTASGNMSESFTQLGFAYKHQFNDKLSAALIFDQPFGADVNYPAGTGYFAQGAVAELKTNALTALLRYKFNDNFSAHGGLRYQTLKASVNVPFLGNYRANGQKDDAFGYVLGVAYEKPEIAMRVALTYSSEIDHSLTTTEGFGALTLPGTTNTAITTPASWNLDFQTGVAANTLVFGSVRYAENTAFRVAPANSPVNPLPLVSFNGNGLSYTLGVGRKFNETWSGAITLGYDKPTGGLSANLAPTDGNYSIGIGGSYTKNNVKITGGIRYIDVGNAQTSAGGGLRTSFTGNSAIAAGIKVGVSF